MIYKAPKSRKESRRKKESGVVMEWQQNNF